MLIKICIHADAYWPNIWCFRWISFWCCKLMLWSSKSRSSSRKIRNIVSLISNSSKISHFNFLKLIHSLRTQNVVNFNITISNALIMQILNSRTNLHKNNSSHISNFRNTIFTFNIFNNLLISCIIFFKLVPIHNLSIYAQLVNQIYFLGWVQYFIECCDVFVIDSLYYV